MTDKPIPHSHDDDNDDVDEHGQKLCPDCGEPMTQMSDDEIFTARLSAITEILEDATSFDTTLILAMMTGEHIGSFVHAKARKEVRAEFVDIMDDSAKEVAAGWAQKKREDRAIKRAGSHPALMPDVSASLK